MAWIPQTVDEALTKMEKRTRYLAYRFAADYPPMRADLEQAGRIATEKAFRYFRAGGGASFETCCGRAVKNAMISQREGLMRDFSHGMVEAPEEYPVEETATEEDLVCGGERYEINRKMSEVMEVVGRLSPEEQRVIAAERQGLSTDEIAEELKLSARQTRRIRAGAVAKLREILVPKSPRRTGESGRKEK
jgi:RNA polymerase sigma factor (sigma-70 family)